MKTRLAICIGAFLLAVVVMASGQGTVPGALAEGDAVSASTLSPSTASSTASSTDSGLTPKAASEIETADQLPLAKRDLQSAVAALRQSPQPEPEINPWPMAKGLALCLGVFCVIVYLLKRLNPHAIHSGKRRMTLLERLPLTPKSALLMVQVDGRTRLIAIGSEQVHSLDGWERIRTAPREFDEMLTALPGGNDQAPAAPQEKGVA